MSLLSEREEQASQLHSDLVCSREENTQLAEGQLAIAIQLTSERAVQRAARLRACVLLRGRETVWRMLHVWARLTPHLKVG